MQARLCVAFFRRQQSFENQLCLFAQTSRWQRAYSRSAIALGNGPSRTRNIGIIAHIDAGKTTTTERMLFYSGHTSRIGDVDDGSTVTDFLPAERARGITIQSAAVTFKWPPHVKDGATQEPRSLLSDTAHDINLIDTPGHADFTFEVLRSLRVLDGAICILDGVAGVEAQTEIVWSQAARYTIPKIIFVNKLDRTGASFSRSVGEIASKLRVSPALCQIPYWDAEGRQFIGVGDIVYLRALRWQPKSDGRTVQHQSLHDLARHDEGFADEIRKARIALVELLAEHDETMVEQFLDANEDHMAIEPREILDSLRRCVLQSPQMLVPVYAGASFRNIGVQPMMDAIVDLLPAPEQRPDPDISLSGQGNTLSAFLAPAASLMKSSAPKKNAKFSASNVQSCALAFKVVNDAKRGVLVYVRVYHGRLQQGAALFNTTLNVGERAGKLLRMFASDAVEVDSIEAGHIGVIVGLKHTRTGDTLVTYAGMNWKTGPPDPVASLQLRPIPVPPPVFFASIEPASLAEEKSVLTALDLLLREDPSLHINKDEETGQIHLAGMGELHLEIACDRLIKDFRAKATVGQIEIGYRESISATSQDHAAMVEQEVNGKPSRAGCVAYVEPRAFESDHADTSRSGNDDGSLTQYQLTDNNRLFVHHAADFKSRSDDSSDLQARDTLSPRAILSALQSGATAGLAKGPTYSLPMHTVDVHIHFKAAEHIFQDTTVSTLAIAARRAVRASLKEIRQTETSVLLEPVMLANISVNEDALGAVVRDLTSVRGGAVLSLGDEEDSRTLDAHNNNSRMIEARSIYVPPDLYTSGSATVNTDMHAPSKRQIIARVPLKEMVGYLKHLRSLTGGRGTFLMQVDQFEPVRGQRLKTTIAALRGW